MHAQQVVGGEWEQAAFLGELARPLVHEVSNYLNSVQLQLAAMEGELAPELHEEMRCISRQGKRLAQLLHQWQRAPRGKAGAAPIYPDALLRDFVASREIKTDGPQPALTLHLGAEGAVVSAPAPTLTALFDFLIGTLLEIRKEADSVDAPLVVRTMIVEECWALDVEDSGTPFPNVAPSLLFEADAVPRYGLRLAACASIARRQSATLRASRNVNAALVIRFALSISRNMDS